MQPIDTRALRTPVPTKLAFEHMKEIEKSIPKKHRVYLGANLTTFIVLIISTVFLVSFFVILDLESGGISEVSIFSLGIMTLFPLTGIIGIITLSVRYVRTARRRWLLSRLAADNGLFYAPFDTSARTIGAAFSNEVVSVKTDSLQASDWEAGRLLFSDTSGKERKGRVDFLRVDLPVPLPHILLDARANDGITGRSNLKVNIRRGQELKLEGDFPRHFRVYVPADYETDALYLFTPDVMATLIDHAADLDIEIVDESLYFYSNGTIVTTDPDRWAELQQVITTVVAQLDAWGRWRDDRLNRAAAPLVQRTIGVAPPGRRLRPKSDWIWVIIGFIGLGFFVYSVITQVIDWISSLVN